MSGVSETWCQKRGRGRRAESRRIKKSGGQAALWGGIANRRRVI
jgi:hypothetical protein